MVDLMRNRLASATTDHAPQRTWRLATRRLTGAGPDPSDTDETARMFSGLLPRDAPAAGWEMVNDELLGALVAHPACDEGLWLFSPFGDETPEVTLWVPWPALLQDVARLGGDLVHAALAECEGRGCLFVASPGGGKTTTVSRLVGGWRALADDAALVWPDGRGDFLASPLPTWGHMRRREAGPPFIREWRVAEAVVLDAVFFVVKHGINVVRPVETVEAARSLYLAFSEHPGAYRLRDRFRVAHFRAACAVARRVLAWRLELSLDADVNALVEQARHAR
jgi:hypothetical protein